MYNIYTVDNCLLQECIQKYRNIFREKKISNNCLLREKYNILVSYTIYSKRFDFEPLKKKLVLKI